MLTLENMMETYELYQDDVFTPRMCYPCNNGVWRRERDDTV